MAEATARKSFTDRMSRSDVSWKLHRFMYRISGGRIGGRMFGVPVLLLRTRGRRTGELRIHPLMYLRDGDRLFVVASNAAAVDRDPGWLHNLRANPVAEVQLGSEVHRVRAEELGPEERDTWWPRLVEHNPKWAGYADETDRIIPIVALHLEAT